MQTEHDSIAQIQDMITELLNTAGFRTRVNYEHSLVKGLVFHISVDLPKLLIGKQGANLQALEHLLFAMVNRKFKDMESPLRFTIDIDDYRANREYQLKQLVKEAISKLKYSQEPLALPVMARHERKFIHNYIQEQFPHLVTESSGEEPNRKIIIKI